MDYKLCILAAGIGQRMQPLTEKINKALLPINDKAAISHIIEKHPKETEIIIAVHYEQEKLKEYLSCCYPERKIIFVDVPKISGFGSGPGYSLKCCRGHLNMPFILSTVDTIIDEECPKPDCNWMGISKVKDPSSYCTLEFNHQNKISFLFDKVKDGSEWAFIGIAGIKDYRIFFNSLFSDDIYSEFRASIFGLYIVLPFLSFPIGSSPQ